MAIKCKLKSDKITLATVIIYQSKIFKKGWNKEVLIYSVIKNVKHFHYITC